jgi:E3 ubiquitin-protein ligase TRIP12
VVDAAEGCATAPLGALVRKLQDALATMERFPVLLNQGPKSGAAAGSLGSQLAALTQPFKLRLCRDPADRALRDYSSNIVLIEPLATLSAVEDFLWSRVRRTNAEEDAIAGSAPLSAPSLRERSAPIHSAFSAHSEC